MTELKSSLTRAQAELGIAFAAIERAISASDLIPLDLITHPQDRAARILSTMRRRVTIIDPPLNEGCWAIVLDLYTNQGKAVCLGILCKHRFRCATDDSASLDRTAYRRRTAWTDRRRARRQARPS